MTGTGAIRLDRRLELEWLDAVAAIAAGEGGEAIRSGLFDLLHGSVGGGTRLGTACHKTVGVLFGTWADVPADLCSFRDQSGCLVPRLPESAWPCIECWWRATPSSPTSRDTPGRLLALRGTWRCHSSLVVCATWGDRSMVDRATSVRWAGAGGTGRVRPRSRPLALREAPGLPSSSLLARRPRLACAQAVRHPTLLVALAGHLRRVELGRHVQWRRAGRCRLRVTCAGAARTFDPVGPRSVPMIAEAPRK